MTVRQTLTEGFFLGNHETGDYLINRVPKNDASVHCRRALCGNSFVDPKCPTVLDGVWPFLYRKSQSQDLIVFDFLAFEPVTVC